MTALSTKPRRRWFAFSLRTLLLLMVVIAAALGWTMHKVREQGRAVAALKERGCQINYFTAEPPAVLQFLRSLYGEPEWRSVFEVDGEHAALADADLVHLRVLPGLTILSLSRTQVTDAGLVHLGALDQLSFLELEETQITDAGLVHLYGLRRLEALWLNDTAVTDAGVQQLRQVIPKLEVYR